MVFIVFLLDFRTVQTVRYFFFSFFFYLQRITVAINCGARICNGGDNTSPFMLMSIHAIDRFNKDNNPGYTDKIVEFVHGETKIPGNKYVL